MRTASMSGFVPVATGGCTAVTTSTGAGVDSTDTAGATGGSGVETVPPCIFWM